MNDVLVTVKKKYIAIFVALIIFAIPAVAEAYTDTKTHWAANDIDLLSAKEILGGYDDGSFRPNKGITRAEFSKIIISSLNLDEEAYSLQKAPSVFKDVPSFHWAKGYIELAYELGIITGYEDKTFGPEKPIRRDELTAILVRTLNHSFEETPKLNFKDAAQIPTWAKDVIAQAVALNLSGGYPDGTFRPGELTTRAQASSFIVRMLEARGDTLEFGGTLKGIDNTKKTMRIEINNEDHIFNFSPVAVIYRKDKKLNISDLTKKLPQKIHFIINSKGTVNYLELVDNLQELSISQDVKKTEDINTDITDNKASLNSQKALNFSTSDYSGTNPGRSLEITKGEIKATELVEATGVQGQDQIIAIIDTGVDPGHPDLKENPKGTAKIIDWVDFTNEMRIDTNTLNRNSQEDTYTIDDQSYQIKDIPTKSGVYRYGFIKEGNLYRDLNFDGKLDDKFLVILSDPEVAGNYDTVYIDKQGNGQIDGQVGYKLFKEMHQYFSIASTDENRQFNLVVGGISNDGSWVKFGADLNGHGTHVAGISSGNGTIKGVAPGSQVMVLKALDVIGETNWDLLKQAINYAANNGAHIINLSLGYYLDETAGNNSLTELIAKVSKEYNIVFTVATGNRGPGLASLATPGNAKEAISVGAYISPSMWKHDYGFEVTEDSLWYFSSVGPRKDGLMIPDVVAPGSAVSTAPMWSEKKYSLVEGTSMAAPHVAGAVALLRDSLYKLGKSPNSEDIRRAISLGAVSLENFGPAEVGSGKIDIVEAWRKLFLVDKVKPLVPQTYNKKLAFGEGLYARDYLPKEISFKIKNLANEIITVNWDSTVSWLKPQIQKTRIVSGNSRTVPIKYDIPEEPGLYSGFLRGDIASTYGYDLTALVTVIRPYLLTKDNDYKQILEGELPGAQYKRYFFNVPFGVDRFLITLNIAKINSQLAGRARAHIIDPSGNEYYMTEYVGLGPTGALLTDNTSASIVTPTPGVWEVVIHSSPALSDYGVKKSQYNLAVSLVGVAEDQNISKGSSSRIISSFASDKNFGGYKAMTYHIIDKKDKTPVNGFIELDGLVYEVKNGKIFIN